MEKSKELIIRIRDHFYTEYNSSPCEVSEEEIEILIKHDCECSNCGESIFEMDDFPEILVEQDEVLCDQCHSDKYRDYCPICDESYLLADSEQKLFVITEETAKEIKMIPGIYEVLKYPFYYGNCLTGFESFFDDSIRLVIPIRMNELKKIECGEGCCEVTSGTICPDCEKKYIRIENYIQAQVHSIVLLKRWEHEFMDWTPERLHNERQWLIHKRINERGIIQKANERRTERVKNSITQ